jgi:glycosyltransferase involved in cell wall biosynthesis
MDFIVQECKKTVSEHDVTYQAYARKVNNSSGLKKLFYSFEYKRQKRWELEMLKKADGIVVHNYKDRDLLERDNIPRDSIKIIEPYINPVFKNAKRDRIEPRTILFWGAMNRPENKDAVEWFLKEIFPGILSRYPDAKLNVVGANPPDYIKKLANKNIIVTGFIKNPLSYFESARLAVAPLRLGAGVKVKVLEALSAGVPVVATNIGGEGISHKNLFFADTPGEFINIVLEKIK